MKKRLRNSLSKRVDARLSLLLLLVLLAALAAPAQARRGPTQVLVDYCFNLPDYSFKAETVGPNVTFTFHPVGATVGGTLAIVYVREGPTGAYPGYPMVPDAAGDFVFTRAIAGGTVLSIYLTYQVGAGGPQRNTAATPHSYAVGTSCLVSAANVPPTVSLTAPAPTAVLAAPATITLAANASDADGTVTKVEFFQGATLLGQDLTAPYSWVWAGVAGDSYTLTARATDNGNATATSAPVQVLVQSPDGYCATRPDYAYAAVTTGPSVAFTFHPVGATAGGNLAIVFIREGPTGAYPGYPMARNAAGDFTFAKAIAGGTVASVYFTYEVGPGGPQQTSLANPHTYTVGTSCRTPTASATAAPALVTALALVPNPGQGRVEVSFAPAQATAYALTLYAPTGARVQALGAGRAGSGQLVALPLSTDGLANGIYLVKLQTDTGVATARLVLNR